MILYNPIEDANLPNLLLDSRCKSSILTTKRITNNLIASRTLSLYTRTHYFFNYRADPATELDDQEHSARNYHSHHQPNTAGTQT